MTPQFDSCLKAKFVPGDTPAVVLEQQNGQFRISETWGQVDNHSLYYLLEIGPGLFPRESHIIDFELGSNHSVIISQQSATKVMPAGTPHRSRMNVRMSVNENSSLVFLAEPTIMLPESALESKTTVVIKKGAKLLFTDVTGIPHTTEKRTKPPQFLLTQAELFLDDKLVFVDSTVVEETPHRCAGEAWTRTFGPSRTAGSLYCAGYPFELVGTSLVCIHSSPTFAAGLSYSLAEPHPGVTIVRVMSSRSHMIADFFRSLAYLLVKPHLSAPAR